jgi:hypothetical protein
MKRNQQFEHSLETNLAVDHNCLMDVMQKVAERF